MEMENEHFYGWGQEDYERHERWINLNYKIYNASGCITTCRIRET